MTNEYYRAGKDDEYIEVSLNWEEISNDKMVWLLCLFKDMIGEYNEKYLIEAIKEVFDLEEQK